MRDRPHLTENEDARLNALRNLRLLDTPPSESFDRITRMASRLLDVPIAAISLADRDRQWLKSRVGIEVSELPRAHSPCSHVIGQDRVFVVPDLLDDPRFADGPLGRAGIRFYAGAPLITRSGYSLGSLCVAGAAPRSVSDDEARMLVDLANMVMTEIEVQNSIGRVHPTSGMPNEYQLLEDLEDLALRSPGQPQVALMVEMVASRHLSQGMRVLGANFVEHLVQGSTDAIRAALGQRSRLYHIGATRCAVLLETAAAGFWTEAVQALDRHLRAPIECSGIPVRPDPAIGVYEFGAGQVKPRSVLRRLYNAVGDARDAGIALACYDESHDHTHTRRFQLLGSLEEALAAPDQLSLVYQPRIDVRGQSCVGVEALLRWRHPQFGNVSPAEFIPLVEETDYIRPVTQWVLDNALAQVSRWRRAGQRHKVSINVSALNLEEPHFADTLAGLLSRHGVPPVAIELEFTESALARDGARVIAQLGELRHMGVEIAIDDFGTGYSSLAYMQKIPANVLKIDRSFVHSLASSERDQKLVRSMIAMAHELGYRVVAEGIETAGSFELLAGWGCDEAQGYFFSRPLPADGLAHWLSSWRCASSNALSR